MTSRRGQRVFRSKPGLPRPGFGEPLIRAILAGTKAATSAPASEAVEGFPAGGKGLWTHSVARPKALVRPRTRAILSPSPMNRRRLPALALLALAVSPGRAAMTEGKRLPWPPPGSEPAACASLEGEAQKYLGAEVVFSRFEMSQGRVMIYADRAPSAGRPGPRPPGHSQPVLKAAQACVSPDVEFWGGGDSSTFILQVPAPSHAEAKRRREGLRGRLERLLKAFPGF